MTNKPPLVVIDMENGFLGSSSRHIIPPVASLVEQWRNFQLPVVFTRFINLPGGQYERLIGWKRLQASPETDICPELREAADQSTIIDKNFYSAFTDEFVRLQHENRWE